MAALVLTATAGALAFYFTPTAVTAWPEPLPALPPVIVERTQKHEHVVEARADEPEKADSPTKLVAITSAPSGATVKIGDKIVGVTPWYGDAPQGHLEVELLLDGHRPWKGRPIEKDGDLKVHANLKRR